MLKKLATLLFLLDSLVIGFGVRPRASGMAFPRRIDGFPIEPRVQSMIHVVWYFVSGSMLAFTSGALNLFRAPDPARAPFCRR